jgi:cytochrome c oxidase cbb3-type subunit 3
MKNISILKLLGLLVFSPLTLFCQEQAIQKNPSAFSNPLFLVLLAVIILLLIVIISFSAALKNIAESDLLINKDKANNNQINKTLFFLIGTFFVSSLNATVTSKSNSGIGGLDAMTFYTMVFVIIIELILLTTLLFQFNYLLKQKKSTPEKFVKLSETKIVMTLTDAVPVEDEERILLEHDYDGIRELDNNLPPWWKYGFYLTIVFAFVYMIYYHVAEIGELQDKEFETEMKLAKQKVEEHMKKSANNVDENTVKLLTEANEIEAGKGVYTANCAVCHGKAGEGTVGPNLTDSYWLHGGSIVEVFKSIKYGWIEKGMKSWKEDLSPVQIAQVSSFIKSLSGTNPPNGKAPQGDLYSEGGTSLPAKDSTLKQPNDTIKINLPNEGTK